MQTFVAMCWTSFSSWVFPSQKTMM